MLRIRTTLNGWSGGPGLATNYFETPLEDLAAATRCVAYVQALWAVQWRSQFPSFVTGQVSGVVDVITAATGDVTNTHVVAQPASWIGDGTAVSLPTATALVCSLLTNDYIAGKRVRGRHFISPVTAAGTDNDGTPGAGQMNAVFGGYGAMLVSLAAGDFPVVWHRPTLGVGGSVHQVVSASCRDKYAVLRSRRD